MTKQIQVGSRAFFSDYEDFQPADNDILELNSEQYEDYYSTRENDVHIFHYKYTNKEQFLEFEFKHIEESPLAVCAFVVPEVAEFLELTLEELFMFEYYFKKINRRHLYVKYIYDCYMENRAFSLTQEQKDFAYNLYNENRK